MIVALTFSTFLSEKSRASSPLRELQVDSLRRSSGRSRFCGPFRPFVFTESYWHEAPIGDYFFKKQFERNNNQALSPHCAIIAEK
jgi:hypothetical protein